MAPDADERHERRWEVIEQWVACSETTMHPPSEDLPSIIEKQERGAGTNANSEGREHDSGTARWRTASMIPLESQ